MSKEAGPLAVALCARSWHVGGVSGFSRGVWMGGCTNGGLLVAEYGEWLVGEARYASGGVPRAPWIRCAAAVRGSKA